LPTIYWHSALQAYSKYLADNNVADLCGK